jgi:hypothetical protein
MIKCVDFLRLYSNEESSSSLFHAVEFKNPKYLEHEFISNGVNNKQTVPFRDKFRITWLQTVYCYTGICDLENPTIAMVNNSFF